MVTTSCVKINAPVGWLPEVHLQKSIKKIVGDNIAALLKRDKINAAGLARILGINPAVVSRWVNGLSLPGADAIDKIRSEMKWRADDLFTEKMDLKERSPPSIYEALNVVEEELGIKLQKASKPKTKKSKE